MSSSRSMVVTVSGEDRPGLAGRLFSALATLGLTVVDVEQVQVRGRLLLSVEVAASADDAERVRRAVAGALDERSAGALDERSAGALDERSAGALDALCDREVSVTFLPPRPAAEDRGQRHLVTVLAEQLSAAALAGICRSVAAGGGNIERIVRLSAYPVVSYELLVSGGDPGSLRRRVAAEAARVDVDAAVQRDGLHRRAKHLIVLDADSTLLQGEVIDMLAERVGRAAEVAAITDAAMAGGIGFEESLKRRLSLLAGSDAAILDALATEVRLAPGARTLVRTLDRLGYATAIVSGGFTQVVDRVASELGIGQVAANVLEIVGGRLTGRLVGPIIGRIGKAEALARFAAEVGVPLTQTVAVGDGANDLDMLAAAGLGIAFNAKPVVRDAADTSLSVPYLDAILYLLGISREEVEAADAAVTRAADSH